MQRLVFSSDSATYCVISKGRLSRHTVVQRKSAGEEQQAEEGVQKAHDVPYTANKRSNKVSSRVGPH